MAKTPTATRDQRRQYTPCARIKDTEPQLLKLPASGKRKAGKHKHPYRPGGKAASRSHRPHHLSPESAHRVLRGAAVANATRRALVRDVACAAGVHRNWPAAAAKRDKKRGTLKRKAGSGRPRMHDKDAEEALKDYLRAEKYAATYDEIEEELLEHHGWTRKTAQRWVKANCNEVWAKIKPLLTADAMKARVAFAKRDVDDDCLHKVHLDEKLFKTWRRSGKRKVPKGDATPYEFVQSKTKVPGVMVIAVIARPQPDMDFDGKICIRRVANREVAKRSSKNRPKGAEVWVDVNMDADWFFAVCRDEIFPAIRGAFAFDLTGAEVELNIDNARPHVGKGNIARLNKAGKKYGVRVKPQSPQSPDFNICDLCLFPSWGRRNHKLQRHARAGSKYDLWDNINKSWAEYPASLIERAWQNRKLAMQEAIRLGGKNNFNIPHVSAAVRADLLPPP